MRFFTLKLSLALTLILACTCSFSQQNVFSRDNVTTGNWGDAQLPWFYGGNQGDPDNGNTSANLIFFGHNNNLIMTLNGRNYQAREIIFQLAATSGRTIGGNTLEMRPNNGDCKIENQSNAGHTFDNTVELFATTQLNPVAGDLIFNGNILTNNNFIDVFGNNSNNLIINGSINGSNGIGVQQNSTVTLNGSNSYTGITFINAGKIVLNANNGLGAISGATIVASGATLELDGADQLSEPLFLNGTGESNQGALRKVNSGSDDYSGSIQIQSNSRILIDQSNFNYFGSLDINGNTLYLGGNGNFNFEPSSAVNNATKTTADGAIFKDGSGRLEFRPTTSITGNLYFLNGEVRQFTGNYPNSGLIILSNVTYRSDGNTDRDIQKPTRVEGDIIIGHSTGGNGQMDFQSTFDLNGSNHTLTMTNDNTISGQITNGSFTKAGTGSLTISGETANTMSDGTVVNEGTLILAKDPNTKALEGATINAGATIRTDNDNQWGSSTPPLVQITGGSLDLNNTNQRLALSGNPTATVSLGSGTLTIEGTTTDTFAGAISGSGNISKEGTGTEILTGNNTYTGSTIITEGILELVGSEVLPDGSQVVLNGGTLRSTSTNTETLGALELAASSTIDLSGTSEAITFSNSSAIDWNSSATLMIIGWTGIEGQPGTGSKIFASDPSDFNEDQLVQFQFSGYSFGAEILATGEIVPKIQNTQRFEDFNRPESDIVGDASSGLAGPWLENEILTSCSDSDGFITISDQNEMVLSSHDDVCTDGGEKFAMIDLTGLYATQFSQGDSLLEWFFNLQQSEANPSLGNRTAFILGASQQDISTGSGAIGYAVAIGENNPGSDNVHLIYFDNGIPNSTTLNDNSLIEASLINKNGHLSIKVTFDPCSSEWTMSVREDGVEFNDPTTINVIGGTAINTLYTSQNLPYLGVYRNHSSSGLRNATIDNVYIPASPASVTSYTWNGSVDTDFQNPLNWSPSRDCTKSNDQLNFVLTGNTEVTNISGQTVANLSIEGGFELIIRDAVGDNTSSILAVNDGNLSIDETSTLIVDVASSNNSSDGIELRLTGSSTGTIDGQIIFRNSNAGTAGRPHRLVADDANEIIVNGTIRVEDLSGNLFDGGANNSIVFNAGATYEALDGGNPFGLTAPSSRVSFQPGSTYRYLSNQAGLSVQGRNYSNLVFDAGNTESLTFNSTNSLTVDSLLILSGTLNIVPTGNSYDVEIGGNLRVESGASFTFDPANEARLLFNGNQGQQIYGGGTVTLGENAIVTIDNASSTETVELVKDLTLFNNFELLNGELQGAGSTLTMAGEDHILQVEGDLVGEVIGNTDEINLVIDGNTTLTGSTSLCDFLNITVSSGKSLTLERSIRCLIGTFDIQSNADLIIGNGGFIETGTDFQPPTYQIDSRLIYRSNSNYSRGVEWGTNSGSGYPHHVIIDGTTLFIPGGNSNQSTPLELAGDLTIEQDADFFMDFSSDDMNTPLVIGGDLNLNGSLSASNSLGGDIELLGDWNQSSTGADFNPNFRQVSFEGTTSQSITGPDELGFDFVLMDNTSGLILNNDISINAVFNFTNGIISPDDVDLDGVEKIIFRAGASVGTVSNNSHYQGIVVKEGSTDFTFPIGDTRADGVSFYQPVRIFQLNEIGGFEAQYFAEAHPNSGAFFDGDSNDDQDFQEISNCDYWSINQANGSSANARIGLTYTNDNNSDGDDTNDNCNSITEPATVFIARWNPFALTWEDGILEGSTTGVNEATSDGLILPFLGGYGDFTLSSGSPDFNILPITLLEFDAEAKNDEVHTRWTTLSEQNNAYFTVEKSSNGAEWVKVDKVKGSENSNTPLSYSLIDQRPFTGISYYRLRQTDFDGETTVSDPVAVEIREGIAFGLDQVYYSNEGLNLIYRSAAPYLVVEIYDMIGKQVHEELIENYGSGFSHIRPDLAKGAYILRLSHGSDSDVMKFVH